MLSPEDWPVLSKLLLLTALLLAAAAVGIPVARLLRIPRVVGYLLLGVALRAALRWLGSEIAQSDSPMSHHLHLALDSVKSLALCLILFEIGAAFDRAHLRAVREQVWKLAVAELAIVVGGVFLATWAVHGVRHDYGLPAVLLPLFLGVTALATAPAATVFVLRQYDAKGPATDHIVAMTGLNNLLSISLFYIGFRLLDEAGFVHAEHLRHGVVAGILLVTVGSAALGIVLGLIFSFLHALLSRFETVLLFLATMLALSALAQPLGISSLIACLFMGLMFVNFTIQPGHFRSELAPLTGPIFALFFVIAGFSLQLGTLAHVGGIGVAYILARLAGKIAAGALGVRWIGAHCRVPSTIGMAMLCQAGVAIGLAKYVLDHWGTTLDNGRFEPHPDAIAFNTVVLASVIVFELIGPLLTRRTAVAAGEVKAISLLPPARGSVRDVNTVVARLGAIFRPRRARDGTDPDDDLTARHVMRTNIETLRESAKMTEVLNFVQHSRLHHFFVLDSEGNLVGTIDFRVLRNVVYNPALAHFLTAYDMANTAPPVVLADRPLREVLDAFHRHDVGSLPVVESEANRRLLGVVEQRDVLRALHIKDRDTGWEADH